MKLKTHTLKKRVIWGFNPISRTVPSKKVYNRLKDKEELNKEISHGRV